MKQKLTIGADPFPPYQYIDSTGVLRGSDLLIVQTAGEKAGFEIELIIDDWAVVWKRFELGELDAVFQLPKTPEREKLYLFSKLLRNANTEVITGDPSIEISALSEIETHKYTLGLIEGIAYGADADALNADRKIFFSNNEKLLKAISDRQVTFGIFDQGVKQFLMDKLSINNIRVISALTFIRPLFIAFRNAEIRDRFDRYLA
ncbi:hypothetical protein AGMMS50229_05450 [Campylobacterota bacterium]|nr:hypothetical protein AGMMS50229_05450 [Campylobacterota bacterium]